MATWQHLRSSTANKRPTTSLADGRIAINTNTASPGLFFKDSAGTGIVKVGPVHVGTTAPNSVPAAGGSSGNYTGEQWLDTSVSPAQMKVWNGSTWVGIVADELPVSKLQDGAARQLIQTDAAGTGVEWTSDVDVPGTLDVTSTATFDSIAQHPLGTAGAPTITFTGDNNTGIYSPGADQVAISTGGSGRLFVDASGNVGVGTTTAPPAGHIARFSSFVFAPGFTVNSSGDTGIYSTIANTLQFQTNGSEKVRITSAGLVGVGTSTPSRQLDVNSTAIFDSNGNGTTTNPSIAIGSTGVGFSYIGSQQLAFLTNSTERVRIDSSGRVGIGTSSPNLALHVSSGTAAGINNVAILKGGGSSSGNGAGLVLSPDSANTYNTWLGSRVATAFGGASWGCDLVLSTNNNSAADNLTERMRITSAGNVGIGSSTPDQTLVVNGGVGINNGGGSGGSPILTITNASGSPLVNATNNASALTFGYNGTEAFRVDSSRRLLVGTSSTSSITSVLIGGNSADPNGYGALRLARNTATPANGDSIGYIVCGDNTHTDTASINFQRDGGTWSGSSKPTRLVFSTTSDGSASPTERFRVTADGSIYFHATSLPGAGTSTTGVGISANDALTVHRAAATACFFGRSNDGEVVALYSGTTQRGTISIAGATTTYGSISDHRLKENVAPIGNATSRLAQLKPSRFNFVEFPEQEVDGFIAHEVQAVVPEAVIGTKDATDENGKPLYQSVDQSKLVPLLTAALQEAVAKIESLEARLTAAGI